METKIVKLSKLDGCYQIYNSYYALKKHKIIRTMYPYDFEDLTGLKLKPGEVAKIMIERIK